MPDYTAAINPGQAPSGYQYGPQAAPAAPSGYTQTGGVAPTGQTYSPVWAANQTQQQFAQGQGGMQGVAAQLGQMIQDLMKMAQNPTGTNVAEQKQEAAQLNAGAVNSGVQATQEQANALGGAAGTPGVAAATQNIRNQGAQNLQSANTAINQNDAAMKSNNLQATLGNLMQLLGLQTNVATNMAQIGQQQQFPILSEQARGTQTVTGPSRGAQYGAQGGGLTLQGPEAAEYQQLTSVPFGQLDGWQRMRLMALRDKLGL